MRRAADPVEFLARLEKEAFAFDFYQAMRRIECLYPDRPRWGSATKPQFEPIRLGQDPSMAFAPASLARFQPQAGIRAARLEVRFMGLLGPNGPMPFHFTEYVRERLLQHGDHTWARFLDLFHHRFIVLFYRAWAQAQPTVCLDRPAEDRFSAYVGGLIGIGTAALTGRDAAPDFAKLYFSGLLVRHARNGDGLAAILTGYFRIPVRVEEFVGHWMSLQDSDRTRLGEDKPAAALGRGAVLGAKVWDYQHKFRLRLGPLKLSQYEDFLPGGTAIAKLVAWVRQYLCLELEWDVRITLGEVDVAKAELKLGRFGRLGWTTWLGRYPEHAEPEDLILNCERLVSLPGGQQAPVPIP